MVEQVITTDAICNQCGESCMVGLGGTDITEYCGLSVDFTGGYSSPVIGDGINYKFDLCEKCLMVIMNQLKIPPDVTEVY